MGEFEQTMSILGRAAIVGGVAAAGTGLFGNMPPVSNALPINANVMLWGGMTAVGAGAALWIGFSGK